MKLGITFVIIALFGCGQVTASRPPDAELPTCDDDNPCTVDAVGDDGECEFTPGNSGVVCREAAGDCDLAEQCDGASPDCPDDALAPSTEVCRASTGGCDFAEHCTGAELTCPPDRVGTRRLVGATGRNQVSQLYELDPATGGVLADLGSIGFGVTGLAEHPLTHVLYGSTSSQSPVSPSSLIQIDQSTGVGTLIGGVLRGADLEFAADGTLYAWDENTDDLSIVDPATGAVTAVGDSTLSSFGSGLGIADGTIFFAGLGNTGALHTISPAAGTVETTPATLSGGPTPPGAPIAAMAYDPESGTMYGVTVDYNVSPRPAFLVVIDTATGVITSRGQTVTELDAITFACAP